MALSLTLAQFFAKDAFKLSTIIVLGAILQLIACACLPLRWAAVPACVVFLNSVVSTILQLCSPSSNTFMTGTIPGRATAQLPSKTGGYGSEAAAESMVVFQLGAQWNHPLGLFAPGVRELSEKYAAMNEELHRRQDELGLLGMSSWRDNQRGSNNTFLTTYFFKDVESIHRFAHEDLHRKAWDWYNPKKHRHIGIFHETYCVPAKAQETMYVNCYPTLQMRTSAKCDSKEGEMWLNPLVSADTPVLKTQYARLGRDEAGKLKEPTETEV